MEAGEQFWLLPLRSFIRPALENLRGRYPEITDVPQAPRVPHKLEPVEPEELAMIATIRSTPRLHPMVTIRVEGGRVKQIRWKQSFPSKESAKRLLEQPDAWSLTSFARTNGGGYSLESRRDFDV